MFLKKSNTLALLLISSIILFLSCSDSGSDDSSQLPAPTLSSSGRTASTISLSWTTVPGATGYYIYEASTSGGTFVKLNTTPTTLKAITVTSIFAGKTCYFKVVAIDSNNAEGTYSNEVNDTTSTFTGTTAAPSLSVGSTTSTSISFSWSFVTAASFNIYGKSSTATAYSKLNSSPWLLTSINITGLTSGTSYNFQVVGVNSSGTEGTFSGVYTTSTASKSVNKITTEDSSVFEGEIFETEQEFVEDMSVRNTENLELVQ